MDVDQVPRGARREAGDEQVDLGGRVGPVPGRDHRATGLDRAAAARGELPRPPVRAPPSGGDGRVDRAGRHESCHVVVPRTPQAASSFTAKAAMPSPFKASVSPAWLNTSEALMDSPRENVHHTITGN